MPSLHFSPLTTLLFQIIVILVVSRLLGRVMRRLGQPLVMAEVLAGILLGPSLFGWFAPDAMVALFPASSLDLLKMLSQFGLVLFMFLVGLELDPRLLRGRTQSSIMISHTSIVLPFGLGAISAVWLYAGYAPTGVSFTAFALFLGVSMSVTAFPVLARILSERNLMTSQVGAITIACAAVDDVTAWCLLAFVVGVARSAAISESLWTTGIALGFVLFMLFVVRPLIARLVGRGVLRDGLTSNVVAIIVLALCASSAMTELIGIHALFGAFLFGAILPKDGNLAELLVSKLETVAVVVLLPLFFAFSGLRTEIGLVDGASDWLVTLALIGVASVGKFGGSTLAARITGIPWREASAIGILMNTRGLMELVVLNVGLDLGVISPTIFTMLVIMALVTTFATTPLLRWVYPPSELALTPALPREVRPDADAAPFTLLMCVADEASGPPMATVASGLLAKGDKTTGYALHLAEPSDRPSVARRKRETNQKALPILSAMDRARSLGLEIQPLEFVSSDAASDICRTADAKNASLVLLGWHRPVLLEGELGGTVRKVLGKTHRAVGVLFDHGLTKLERVLVMQGGPEDAEVERLGARFGARVHVTSRKLAPSVDLAAEVVGYDLVVLGMSQRERAVEALAGSGIAVLALQPGTAPPHADGENGDAPSAPPR